jgi:hypothetical protein
MTAIEAEDDDFFYEVSEELLERFQASTVEQRLDWLDEMRTFSWDFTAPSVRDWRRRVRDARRGLPCSP